MSLCPAPTAPGTTAAAGQTRAAAAGRGAPPPAAGLTCARLAGAVARPRRPSGEWSVVQTGCAAAARHRMRLAGGRSPEWPAASARPSQRSSPPPRFRLAPAPLPIPPARSLPPLSLLPLLLPRPRLSSSSSPATLADPPSRAPSPASPPTPPPRQAPYTPATAAALLLSPARRSPPARLRLSHTPLGRRRAPPLHTVLCRCAAATLLPLPPTLLDTL